MRGLEGLDGWWLGRGLHRWIGGTLLGVEALAGEADVARVAVAGDPGAAQARCDDRGGAGADEGIDDELAGGAGGEDELLDQGLGLLGGMRGFCGHAFADDRNLDDIARFGAERVGLPAIALGGRAAVLRRAGR